MKKSRYGVFKKIFLFSIGVIFVAILSCGMLFVHETKDAKLDKNLFVSSKNQVAFSICDLNGEKVDSSFLFGEKELDMENLPSYVKNSFIAVEDKRFYNHHGVDTKRIVGATIKNLKSRKFSEGASTITQQLIKNTHLSREKTLKRKLKEIKLAFLLEKEYSKDEILKEYLETIYFGNGAYGIESASNLYFSKSANELELSEATLLAGIINAPSFYDPFLHPERCEKRRNLVLKLMKNQGYISNEEYEKNAKTSLKLVKNDIKTMKIAQKCIIYEACEILELSESQLKNSNVEIECGIDFSLQNKLDELVLDEQFCVNGRLGHPATVGVLVLDNKTKNVVAVSGVNGFSLDKKRQPGSVIKPIIVYAPAIEEGQIFPESIINDAPIEVDGYSPSNASKTFQGNVSARVALEKSLNVPAVKILSNLGVQKAKKFATKLGFEFDKNDSNLALALGGMTDGVTLKQIADAFSSFATNGDFCKSKFISKITSSDGKVLYERNDTPVSVMKESTAFLVSDMLKGVIKNGTAKRLSGFDFDISAKTGTVGASSSSDNSDAYLVCFTSEHTIVTYFGENSKSGLLPSSVNGASFPTVLAKNVLQKLYADHIPENFVQPKSVENFDIDTRSLKNGDVLLASPQTLDRFKKSVLFSTDNLPNFSNEIDVFKTTLEVKMEENQKPVLSFVTKVGYEFLLLQISEGKMKVLCNFSGTGEKFSIVDESTMPGKVYEYYVLSKPELQDEKFTEKSNSIKLLSY